MRAKYAVLVSAASEALYGPELVCPSRFERVEYAMAAGESVVQAAGLEYEIMTEVDGQWRSSRGETAVDVIRRRWT